MDQLQIALIGCGRLGATHAKCLSKIQGARLSAYVDIHEPAAQALLEQFGGDYAATDPQKVFDDDRIDAVYICTLHDTHAPLSIAAVRAGKHVLVEKPLALNLEECQAVADAVAGSDVFLMPAFKMRYYPLIQMAHEFIPQPQVLVGQMMDGRWADDVWAQDPVKGGANVHSQGCHTTDILRYLSGSEPVRIAAAGGSLTHPGHPCIDQCVASITFANGHVASWIQGDAGLGQFTSKFFMELFDNGRSVQIYDRFKKATFFDGSKTWTEERPDEEGFQLENEAFIKALSEGKPPELTAHDGIQATRMVLLAEHSMRNRIVVEF